jgi:hypothetical protein
MLLPLSPDQLIQLRQKRAEEESSALSTAKFGRLNRQSGWKDWFDSKLTRRF